MSRVRSARIMEQEREKGGWMLDSGGRETLARSERSDAARNRKVVLETARSLFGERGVTCVTMEDIAREARVGKGTLYRRFPHKGVLCRALLDSPTRRFQEETLRALGEPGVGPLQKLDAFLARLVDFTEENLDMLYGGNEPLCGADRLERFSHPAHDWRRATILGLMRAAERDGELEGGLDLEYLAAAMLAPIDVDFYYYQRRVQGIPQARISAGLRSLVPSRQST